MVPDQLTTKVRLVRCPKCRNLLPELPDFQVYRCGGCGVTLQAKNRINGMRMSSSLNETVASQKIGLDHVSEDKKSSSSSPNAKSSSSSPNAKSNISSPNAKSSSSSPNAKSSSSSPNATPPESGECFPGSNNERHQSKSSEGSKYRSNDEPTIPDPGECFSDQNNGRSEDKSSEDRESSSLRTPNGTSPKSGECISGQNSEKNQDKSFEDKESSSSSPPTATLPDSAEFFLEQNNGKSEDKPSKDKVSDSSSRSASIPESGECSLGQDNEVQSKSSEGKTSSSSSLKANFPDSAECFLDQKLEKHQSQSSEGHEPSSSSHEVTLPLPGKCFSNQKNERDQMTSSEGNESSSSIPKATFPDSGDCFPHLKKEESQNKSNEDKEFGSSSAKATIPDLGECTSTQTNGRNPDKFSEDCHGQQIGDFNFLCEKQNNRSDSNHSRDFDGVRIEVLNDICSSIESADIETEHSLPISRTRSGVSIHDEGSPLAKSNVDAKMNKVVDSDFKSSSAVDPGATERSSSIVTAYVSARESTSPDTISSSPDLQLKEPQNSVLNGFNYGRFPDTYENEGFNPSSEFSDALREMSKSPAGRSHHAYDGSVSSYDGRDDRFSNRNMPSNFVHSEARPRRDKFMMDSDSELQLKARDSWSNFSDKSDNAMKYRNWDQDELLQPSRQGHPSRDWNRFPTDEYQTRMAFHSRASQSRYQNVGPTNHLHDEYQSKPGYQSSVKSVDSEHDKKTLLRMVYELQNQVNDLNQKANGSIADKRTPQFRNYEASEEELYHGPNYQRYLRSQRGRSHYPPKDRRFMRIPFSSEATTSRHQVDPSYLHRGPPAWQYSAPLPLSIRCSNNELCRVHPGQNCWTSYDKSSLYSQERYAESDYSTWGRETMSEDDMRHRRHDAKKYAREQHYLAKRHFRPIAGGAPIITCYNCLKLLQIPADFLLFKRRCHRLRCGGCSEVLKFSLQKSSHIVPYEDCAMDPPPSEVGDYSAANFASTSQHGDPVSFSHDYGYGLAYRKGYSTEGDPGTLAPSNSLRGRSDDRNMKRYQKNRDKNPAETYVSARPSLSSEIDELSQRSRSPLHRLMGYATPSLVIRGAGSSHTGTSSYAMQG